jgi:hypothetical protein
MQLPSPKEIVMGTTFDPSMLTYNGNLLIIVVHAFLWWTPAFIVLAGKDDLEKGQGDVEKEILQLYFVFSISTPIILVVYEILMAFMGKYPGLKAVGQGLIFGFGYLTLGLGAASTATLNDKDHIPLIMSCLFLTSSALGMFTTFYTTFMKKFDEQEGKPPTLLGK